MVVGVGGRADVAELGDDPPARLVDGFGDLRPAGGLRVGVDAVEVCGASFAASLAVLAEMIEDGPGQDGSPLERVVAGYLSPAHRAKWSAR